MPWRNRYSLEITDAQVKARLDALAKRAPEVYADMIDQFGEEAVRRWMRLRMDQWRVSDD